MQRILVSVCLILFAASLPAAEIQLKQLKVGSQTYEDVKILGANVTDVYFQHSQGLANVKIRQLDKGLQQRLNYNPQAAEAAEKEQIMEDFRYHTQLLASIVTSRSNNYGKRANGVSLSDPITEKSLLGKIAPELRAGDWNLTSADLAGKHLLVAFWSTNSEASIQALSALKALQTRFTNQLQVLGVSAGASVSENAKSQAQSELSLPVLADANFKMASQFEVNAVPTAVLMNEKRVILYHGHPAALDEEMMARVLGVVR